MADNKPFDQVSVALDRFADALRDLCTTIVAGADGAMWSASDDRTKTEDGQLNELAVLLGASGPTETANSGLRAQPTHRQRAMGTSRASARLRSAKRRFREHAGCGKGV